MANIEAQIKPGGLSQRNLVDFLYMAVAAIKGICAKLDDDGGVPLATYEANVFTAIFNGAIEDSRGNQIINAVSGQEDRFFIVSPQGIDDRALNEIIFQLFDMLETLTEQLDTDVLTDDDYEALCFTALLTWIVENCKGTQIGNGTVYYFRPGGMFNQDQLVDLLYQVANVLETLTEKLDLDGTVTDTDYESLWFTATVTMRLGNSQGNVVGNDITVTP